MKYRLGYRCCGFLHLIVQVLRSSDGKNPEGAFDFARSKQQEPGRLPVTPHCVRLSGGHTAAIPQTGDAAAEVVQKVPLIRPASREFEPVKMSRDTDGNDLPWVKPFTVEAGEPCLPAAPRRCALVQAGRRLGGGGLTGDPVTRRDDTAVSRRMLAVDPHPAILDPGAKLPDTDGAC